MSLTDFEAGVKVTRERDDITQHGLKTKSFVVPDTEKLKGGVFKSEVKLCASR